MRCARHRNGFSLPSAIFILVVLSLAGVFMVNMAGVQQRTSILTLLSARVYWGAVAGSEWSADRSLAAGACQSGAFTLGEGGLDGISVTVTCTESAHVEVGTTTVYHITSLAEYGNFGDKDYASRTVEISVADVP